MSVIRICDRVLLGLLGDVVQCQFQNNPDSGYIVVFPKVIHIFKAFDIKLAC